jgi:tRNA A-37 threonylcarbamoyl transferase component Bud32
MESNGETWTEMTCGGVRWRVLDRFAPTFADWCSRNFPFALERRDSLLKDTVGSLVASAEGWVIKESTARKGRSRLRFGLRRSGARRAARLALRSIAAGIPVPVPVAWATVREGVLRVREYLVTVEVPKASPLTSLLDRLRPGDRLRAAAAVKYGSLLGSFHSAGLSNRDLKDPNVLVDAGMDFVALDMDGVQPVPLLPRWRAGRDFYAVVRSLGRHGWSEQDVQDALLDGYNARVPARLHRRTVPFRRIFLS